MMPKQPAIRRIKPDYDSAAMDGEVQLNSDAARVDLHGIGVSDSTTFSTGAPLSMPDGTVRDDGNDWTSGSVYVAKKDATTNTPDIYGQVAAGQLTMSLTLRPTSVASNGTKTATNSEFRKSTTLN